MSPLAVKILIVGVPLVVSLSWFLFWVLRLTSAARRLKSGTAAAQKAGKDSPDDPAR
jgi:hypothetical protein